MSQSTNIAKNCTLRTSNFYLTINSNKLVVLIDQLTPEEEAYFKKFDTVWRSYFDQSPDVWLKFLLGTIPKIASSLLTPWPMLNFSHLDGQ